MSRAVRLRIADPAKLAPLRSHDPHSPYYSGVFFHGMDHGPSFGAVQSRSLRGCPLLHADRTGLVHRTQLHAPSAALRVGRPARLPCRGGLPPHSVSAVTVTVTASPFSILSVWFFLRGAPRRKRSCPGKIVGACPGACPGDIAGACPGARKERFSPVRSSARPLFRSSARPHSM